MVVAESRLQHILQMLKKKCRIIVLKVWDPRKLLICVFAAYFTNITNGFTEIKITENDLKSEQEYNQKQFKETQNKI